MSIWKIFQTRKRADFFNLLEQQGEKSLATCEALINYLDGKLDGEEVKKLEQEADDTRRVLIDELNNTFITPMDREDIFELSSAIDDMADYAKNTVRELQAFEVEPTDRLKKMAEFLKDGAHYIDMALRHLKRNPNVAKEYILKAKRVEKKMNRLYLKALAELFSNEDIRLIFSYREIYRHMNRGADRVNEAADIIAGVIVKLS